MICKCGATVKARSDAGAGFFPAEMGNSECCLYRKHFEQNTLFGPLPWRSRPVSPGRRCSLGLRYEGGTLERKLGQIHHWRRSIAAALEKHPPLESA